MSSPYISIIFIRNNQLFNHPIQQTDLFRPDFFVRCFKNDGQIVESGIVHDAFENFIAQKPLADTIVPVNMAAERFHAVVEVNATQVAETDDAVELPEGFFIAFGGNQVVAGCKGVAGIEADTNPGFILHMVNDKF